MMYFTDADAAHAWDRGATAWDAFVETGADFYRHEVHGPALLAACEPVAGRRVLDLGCGQGYFTRQLARCGGTIVGIDIAPGLLALARAHEQREPLGISYRQLSALQVADGWEAETFDLVAACMSLQDMADVRGALRGSYSVLRSSGRMVFSVPHPATDMAFREWERDSAGRKLRLRLDRYFESGPAVCHWNMARLQDHWSTPCWRYTLGEWMALVTQAGFTVRMLYEPRPTAAQVARYPQLDDCHRMPYFLIFDLLKPEQGAG